MEKKSVKALVGGLAIGASLGVLFAPKKGKETRDELKVKLNELVDKAKDVDMDDVKEYVVSKSEEIEASLKELDKEKVLTVAKDKAKDIEKSAKDLVTYVKKKGEPVLEELAVAAKEKATVATKAVLAKLESSNES